MIEIEVRIHEDEQATIRKVTVTGNDKTNDQVIYRELRTVREIYSAKKTSLDLSEK